MHQGSALVLILAMHSILGIFMLFIDAN